MSRSVWRLTQERRVDERDHNLAKRTRGAESAETLTTRLLQRASRSPFLSSLVSGLARSARPGLPRRSTLLLHALRRRTRPTHRAWPTPTWIRDQAHGDSQSHALHAHRARGSKARRTRRHSRRKRVVHPRATNSRRRDSGRADGASSTLLMRVDARWSAQELRPDHFPCGTTSRPSGLISIPHAARASWTRRIRAGLESFVSRT